MNSRPETALPFAGMGAVTWRPCAGDLSVWRMLCLQPDRELFATINITCSQLLAFDIEWDDGNGCHHFITWGAGSGLNAGVVDAGEEERAVREQEATPRLLGTARRIVEEAGIVSLVSTWILEQLSRP